MSMFASSVHHEFVADPCGSLIVFKYNNTLSIASLRFGIACIFELQEADRWVGMGEWLPELNHFFGRCRSP